jgi:hypothetical protein
MQLNIDLREEDIAKISMLQQITGQDLTEILHNAIENYYPQVDSVSSVQSPFQIFTEVGLVDCLEGESDLSTNYKSIVKSYILKKYDHS